MQDIVQYLVENPEVVEKVKNGHASLIGVNLEDLQGLLDGFLNSAKTVAYYWY